MERRDQGFLGSGLSQENYVRKHGICRATLAAWSKRLGISLGRGGISSQDENDPFLSFTELKPLGRSEMSSSLKIEIIFPQGHTLKLETEGAWEKAGAFVKALVE